jgi:hypothetical protein
MPYSFDYTKPDFDIFARYSDPKIEVCDVTGIDFNELTNEIIDGLPTI